jgi:muramoyltetrapeptide carboxypeptidase
MNLILPPPLKPGDCVGIAAPASHFEQGALEQGVAALTEMGFQVRPGAALFDRAGYLAGTDAARAGDLLGLFQDPEIKAILCARGGYGSMRLLPRLDWELIRRHPKIFLGFSDISVLLNLFYQRAGLIAYHGPLVTELGRVSEATRRALRQALTTRDDLLLRPPQPRILNPGRAEGPLMGGNLTLLCHMLGTAHEPRVEGHILFIEDRGEELYRIDRMLWQLKLAGWFEAITGLVLGYFTDCGALDGIDELAADMGRQARIPVMAGFEIGHEDPNMTLPVGCPAILDTQRGELRIKRSG